MGAFNEDSPTVFTAFLFLQILQQALALYIQYSLDRGDMVEICLTVVTASIVVGIPIAKLLLDKFGRKTICFGSVLVQLPLLLSLIFIPGSLAVMIPILVAFGVGLSALFMLPWIMLPDVLDEFKFQTGKELDTYFYGAFNTIKQLGTIIAASVITASLEISGYKTGACSQPESVGFALRIVMSVFPMANLLLSSIFVWKHPITEATRQRTKAALQETRSPDVSTMSSDVTTETPSNDVVISPIT
ncbi:sodium-dependent lysophosphatidylcholine symporter 1-like [Branchiostoma lanceolatum]|uniref:sodium-dependent lysophosphatidylcholine symporter 1-like n=1 Tax=Branchiostoma lanceolatum TaxID=7740 RepID=UPI0034520F8C